MDSSIKFWSILGFGFALLLQPILSAPAKDKQKQKHLQAAYEAIQRGDLKRLKESLASGLDINSYYGRDESRGKVGQPLLLAAVEKRTPEIVAYLIKQGADPNATGGNNLFPLHTAAYYGDLKILNLLIEAGANLNYSNYYVETAMTVAAIEGNNEIIKQLLAAGAAPQGRLINDSRTLLMLAANATIRRTLIEAGAPIHARGGNDQTALMYVAQSDLESTKLLIQSGSQIEATDIDGETALFKAAYSGQSQVVGFLLESGANVMHKNSKGQTALDIAKFESERTPQIGSSGLKADYKGCIVILETAISKKIQLNPAEPSQD